MKKKIYKIICVLLILTGLSIYLYTRYPITYTKYIRESAEEFNIDPYLIASIINVESRYDKYATSIKDAKGLMQITPKTGQWGSEVLGMENYKEDDLYDPETNIKLGTWYISRLMEEFDGDISLALAAYNGGSGNVKKWLEDTRYSLDGENLHNIPFEETENYLERVNKNYKVYSKIYRLVFKNTELEDGEYICFLHGLKRKFRGSFNKSNP